MILKRDDYENLIWGSVPDDDYEIIDEGDWISDGKYEHKEVIFKYKGKFYQIADTRTGSYYSDYTYISEDDDTYLEATEVEPVEVTVIEYRAVK